VDPLGVIYVIQMTSITMHGLGMHVHPTYMDTMIVTSVRWLSHTVDITIAVVMSVLLPTCGFAPARRAMSALAGKMATLMTATGHAYFPLEAEARGHVVAVDMWEEDIPQKGSSSEGSPQLAWLERLKGQRRDCAQLSAKARAEFNAAAKVQHLKKY